MQIQQINSQPNFQGLITVSGLSKSQEKVYNGLKDMLYKKVADKDYLILHINGSISPVYIANDSKIDPKYVIMHTQVKEATAPTAIASMKSLSPNDWLKNADRVISAHLESDLYVKAIDGKLDSFWVRLKNRFHELIKKEK